MITVEQCWRLAQRWYRGRLEPDWTRASVEEMEAIFAEVGLTGEFWRLGDA